MHLKKYFLLNRFHTVKLNLHHIYLLDSYLQTWIGVLDFRPNMHLVLESITFTH